MIKRLFPALALAALVSACGAGKTEASYGVIPAPQEVSLNATEAPFMLDRNSVIAYPEGDSALHLRATQLADYIFEQAGFRPSVKAGSKGAVVLNANLPGENPEAYTLSVSPEGIALNGTTDRGVFYGLQTLRQSIPTQKASAVLFPAVEINDSPRFGYRGAHLDVSRHFFPTDSVEVFLDMMAMHKLNTFHWHLSDHQGWRPEIKSRPLLTEVGAKRPHTIVGRNGDIYDSIPVEGYYTQEQMRHIVQYAAERGITVIPEIDLPGHFTAGLAAYPSLGCTGGPYEVYCAWEDSGPEVLCVGNPEVENLLDDIFGELCDIFPSTLFHIGGDECPKERWMECPKCNAVADSLGLRDDEHGTRWAKLQNHLMAHVADFLRERGRRVIGWDEVLDSDFAPDAVVMAWRNEENGIIAAQRGHDVIMTPARYVYFDFYQSPDQASEPLAIGGYVPVELVYNYNPVPDVLTPEEQKHILGLQANLWTEFVPTFSHVQYMELPRMAALSEVQWSNPDKKDINNFVRRLIPLTAMYRNHGWNYATHVFDVRGTLIPDPASGSLKAVLSTFDGVPVHYTTDGSEPTAASPLFTDTLVFTEPVALRAVAVRDGKEGRIYNAGMQFSKASFKPVEVSPAPHPRYTFDGTMQLTDACTGSSGYTDGRWLGWVAPEINITVDLGNVQTVSEAYFRNNTDTGAWIFPPRTYAVALSTDGVNFKTVAKEEYDVPAQNVTVINNYSLDFEPQQARYVRYTIEASPIPDWHPGKGANSFIFIDELGVK
ncbi:MAG: family 20 glycosylhydrolase [Bacteroidales bacterium]|nr:family 20 glycosylhydrolase [Bacteroidales bacterium]